MTEYKEFLLKELATSQTGPFGSQLHESDYVEVGTPIVTVEHLGVESFTTQNLPFVCDEDKERLNKYILKEGDIVFSRVGSIDRSTYVSKKEDGWMFSGRCIRVRANEKVNSKYLSYYFRQSFFKRMMLNISVGATMPSLNTKLMDAIPIKLPSIVIQKKVSAFLYAIDKNIILNNNINAELEAMAKLIYDYWFVQFDFPDENGKPYKSSGGKMVYNEELKREIPDGWIVGSLLDIAKFTNGIACQKYRPAKDESYYRVIKIKEMGEGFTDKTEFVSQSIPDSVVVKNGDVLFSWSATLDVKIWTGGKGGLNQHIFKVTSEKFPRSYYYFEVLRYLNHFKMVAELIKTTMGHITRDHLKQSRIAIPSLDLIEMLHLKIDPFIQKIVKAREENQKLAELRDWLLPMLMNGQVKVK